MNISGFLNSAMQHTSQIAALKACYFALEKVINEFHALDSLVIKSDSAYLVRGATEWLPRWNCNGWINSAGRPVVTRTPSRTLSVRWNTSKGRAPVSSSGMYPES